MTPPQSQERREAEPAIAKSLSVVASKPAGASVSHAPTPQTRKPVAAVPTIQNSSIHTSRNQMQMVPRSVPFGGDNGYSARANGDRDLFPSRQEFSAPSRMHETQRGGVDSRVGTGAGPPRSVYERPVPYVRTYQERRTQPRGRPADRLQNGRKTRNQKKGPPHRALQSDGLTPNELRARDGLPPRKRKAEELDDGELDYGEPEPAGKKAKNGLRALEGDKLKLDDYMRNRHPQVDVCYKPFDLFTLGKPSNGVRNIEIPLQIGAPFNISVTGAGPTSAAAEENAATQALARLSAVPGAGSIGG
ncbi:hypothetical protein CALVIDRAFT_534253 [Calocera viscosa TUFC12733]|uniref:Uncharacterized protein n=1 Tax=Calocera viscosa (strain TUFC12733) TaxID=1330018 RepID=A0A167PZB2_CALVF|nr:hypothetical protein CALVIDRAFT_534253 [Calocera viscosa TUFC12733]